MYDTIIVIRYCSFTGALMESFSVNATRLRTARRMLGMSRENLSAATDGRVSVGAIAKLEQGRSVQDAGLAAHSLSAALQAPYEFLLSQPENNDYQETPSWRAVKKVPDYVSEGLRERLTYYTDKYRDLEEDVERKAGQRSDLSADLLELRAEHKPGTPLGPDVVEQYAERLRQQICVSQERSFACLERVTEVMESFGIKVACWPLPPGISGLSMTYGWAVECGAPPGAAVLVNRNHPVERRRFSLAHEWGHLVLPQVGNWRHDETACNRFAGALLMPQNALRRDVAHILDGPITATRDAFQPELLQLKTRYGVSIAALLRRCQDTGLIASPDLYSQICRRLGQRGWFRTEPEPRWELPEQPQGFTNLLNRLEREDRQRGIDKDFRNDIRFLEAAE